MRRRGQLLLALLAALASPAEAQEQATGPQPSVSGGTGAEGAGGVVRSPVLTINPDELFAESLYGERVTGELNEASEELAAENREIEAELTAEERSLTERRPDMEPEAFREEAEAFDARVQQIREEQDAKEAALQSIIQQGQADFREAVRPILGDLMIERGAAVLLDRRSVVLGVEAIDITDEAIDRIDAGIGDGTGEVAPPEPAAELLEGEAGAEPSLEGGDPSLSDEDTPEAPQLPAQPAEEDDGAGLSVTGDTGQ